MHKLCVMLCVVCFDFHGPGSLCNYVLFYSLFSTVSRVNVSATSVRDYKTTHNPQKVTAKAGQNKGKFKLV